jgi:hypothetical protein
VSSVGSNPEAIEETLMTRLALTFVGVPALASLAQLGRVLITAQIARVV